MERREHNLMKRLLTILFFIPAILLLTIPAVQAGTYDDGGVHDVYSPEDYLNIGITVPGTTVNLYADILDYVVVGSGSFFNIYSGDIGSYISVDQGPPSAVVTVYGKAFSVSNGTIDSNNKWLPEGGSGTLTVIYGDDTTCDLLFYSDVSITLVYIISEEEISIDIKPGSYPNSINLGSKGVVPVAVLTTEDFDAETVDPATVEFAGASPLRWAYEDVDDDGDLDIVFHFKTQEMDLDENSTEATLTGQTDSGDDISGTDDVRIVPPKSKNNKKK
jgi:hypothetical protein